MLRKRLFSAALVSAVLVPLAAGARGWMRQETEHFIVVYVEPHSYLVPHVLRSAESSLARLRELFAYEPSEKILITMSDFADHGTASATTTPRNRIRLEIEPFELGYENTLFHDRIQWLMNHELVHVVVNDRSATSSEAFGRSLFSKVPPEPAQPLSILYSYFTNQSRYTPRWHQEGIAVFLETWLSGGFGRSLSSFDETYFRSMVLEAKSFPSPAVLDAKSSQESFLLDMLSYFYGARFVTYLASSYGAESVLEWYDAGGYGAGFERRFGTPLEVAWTDFERAEIEFQRRNLDALRTAPLTRVEPVRDEAMGWASQPGLDRERGAVYFASHRPHHLAGILRLDLATGAATEVATLPTPSQIGVASTALDAERGRFFYTTNNNQLYRDVHVLDLDSGESRLLFEDARLGDLTVASETRELWGVRHAGGRASLVTSPPPYERLEPVATLEVGDTLQHLSASPSGRWLAATLHQSSGRQAIIIIDVASLRGNGRLVYRTVSEDGSPEFPSFSRDEHYVYWSAYTNGVSNIYRHRIETSETEAMSHTLRGLFRPVYVNEDTLFAFEFTTEGFIPVRLGNAPVSRLPATRYFGQAALEANPDLAGWSVERLPAVETPHATRYRGASALEPQSFLPIVSGFGDGVVFGVYGHVADPLSFHDVTFEAGVSGKGDAFHLKGAYRYKGIYRFEIEHNPSSFYDLVNERKKGWRGTRLGLSHTRFWKYDNPHSVQQTTQINWFTGIDSIEDNLVQVSTPDVVSLETGLTSRHLRRAIGSVDSESGNAWTTTFTALGAHGEAWDAAAGIHANWERFTTWGAPHNVLRTEIAGGYRFTAEDLEVGRFYFGGFGNQYLEDQPVKQYRQVFRFPGVPVSSVSARRFAKGTLEHGLPPLRFGNAGSGGHFLSHLDASWFTQGLVLDEGAGWVNLGAQLNLAFRLWSNLETTLSFGVARAWGRHARFDEWFVSVKLLR